PRLAQIFMPCRRSSATTWSMPFFSIVRSPFAEIRRDTQRFSVSTQNRCVRRFGKKRRRFLLLACETRLPTPGFLPVISQTRDIRITLKFSNLETRDESPLAGPAFIPAFAGDLKSVPPPLTGDHARRKSSSPRFPRSGDRALGPP